MSDERHPDDRQDASNVTLASLMLETNVTLTTIAAIQCHPECHPHDRVGEPAVHGLHRSDDSPVLCPLPPDLIQVLGFWIRLPEGQQASAGMAHCLRLTNSTGRWPNTIARAPLPLRTPYPAAVRSRPSGHSGRLWRAAGLTNPKAEQWWSREEGSRRN